MQCSQAAKLAIKLKEKGWVKEWRNTINTELYYVHRCIKMLSWPRWLGSYPLTILNRKAKRLWGGFTLTQGTDGRSFSEKLSSLWYYNRNLWHPYLDTWERLQCRSGLWDTCAVSQFRVYILQRSIWRLSQIEGSSKCSPQMLLLFPVFGGCMATILHHLTYPKMLCVPKIEERKSENGKITWRRSSLSQAWAAEIVT